MKRVITDGTMGISGFRESRASWVDFCPNCGAPLTYYHDTERTRAVCSKKCQGWKVVEEIDYKEG